MIIVFPELKIQDLQNTSTIKFVKSVAGWSDSHCFLWYHRQKTDKATRLSSIGKPLHHLLFVVEHLPCLVFIVDQAGHEVKQSHSSYRWFSLGRAFSDISIYFYEDMLYLHQQPIIFTYTLSTSITNIILFYYFAQLYMCLVKHLLLLFQNQQQHPLFIHRREADVVSGTAGSREDDLHQKRCLWHHWEVKTNSI